MGKIVDVTGKPVSSKIENAGTQKDRIHAMFAQANTDPMARGEVAMQLAKHMTTLALIPSKELKALLKADEAYEFTFQTALEKDAKISLETKKLIREKRSESQKCLRAFLKIKKQLNKAMREAGILKEIIVP